MYQLNLFDSQNGGQTQNSPTQNLIISPKQFELRDYQKQLKSYIYQLIRDGQKRILVYAPTGSGKTAILSSILKDALSRNKRSMLIIHRDFLVEQSRQAMIKTGIDSNNIGIIKAGFSENRDRMIQIAGLQSLQNRATPDQDGKTFICNDWLFGSIFGGRDNNYNRQLLLGYLEQFAPDNKNKDSWTKYHLELEFGKPGKQYRTGKHTSSEAKIGRNTKLDWWEILQCSPGSSWEEIKNNYRELVKVYHPDSSGFDSDYEMQLLNVAFDRAKAIKG
jgi:Type III restriction enzyme, res subunit/DnaJ domain